MVSIDENSPTTSNEICVTSDTDLVNHRRQIIKNNNIVNKMNIDSLKKKFIPYLHL